MGHWISETTVGPVLATPNSFGEIEALKMFAQENELNGFKEVDLIISFGGESGSFFADAFRLKRYRWNKLPIDLEDEIQKEVCRNGYGKIYDVAMNAVGGWVMQLNKGARFRWGGQLPEDLKQALQRGSQRKATISVMLSNHLPYAMLTNVHNIASIPQPSASYRIRPPFQRWTNIYQITQQFPSPIESTH
jgi:hypothetical protein